MQSLKMALKSISGNKSRALLTMLGIIIGVMALVILVSLVTGATTSVTDAVSSIGSNLITVTVSDDKGSPITLDDLNELRQTYSSIGRIAPVSSDSLTIKSGSESDSITVYGTTADYYDIEELNLLLGRFIKTTDVDNNNYVCVINEATADELVGYLDCVGEEISLDGTKFTIAGVLEDNDSSLTAAFGSDSYTAYIPYTTLQRVSTTLNNEITTFMVSPSASSDMDTLEAQLTALLLERFDADEDAFTVSNQNVLEDTVDDISSIFAILLGGIAAISLIVGGIGIMNIMLVTVTERTKEIGIRKSIGAKRGVILRQFLIEAIVLCMMGCGIGIFFSWIILQLAEVVVSSLSMNFVMNGNVVLIAVGFCFLIGVVFGLYPANKAAKMKPIDALHYGG